MSVSMSVSMSLSMSAFLSACLPMSLFLLVCGSICPDFPSVSLPVCMCICLSVYLYFDPCVPGGGGGGDTGIKGSRSLVSLQQSTAHCSLVTFPK